MKDTELRNKVIAFLEKEAAKCKTFPQMFTAQETAEAVGGVATRIGVISNDVVAELSARGINIRYEKTTTSRRFVISK